MHHNDTGVPVSNPHELAAQGHDPLVASVMKAASAWFLVGLSKLGINTWSDVAAFVASVYTCLLIIEWFWKKWRAWRVGHVADAG